MKATQNAAVMLARHQAGSGGGDKMPGEQACQRGKAGLELLPNPQRDSAAGRIGPQGRGKEGRGINAPIMLLHPLTSWIYQHELARRPGQRSLRIQGMEQGQ